VTLNARFFESEGNCGQQPTIVDLRFTGNVQTFRTSRPKVGFQVIDLRTIEALDAHL
jgi:hypothetical protein